jgi:hypothetical protein
MPAFGYSGHESMGCTREGWRGEIYTPVRKVCVTQRMRLIGWIDDSCYEHATHMIACVSIAIPSPSKKQDG